MSPHEEIVAAPLEVAPARTELLSWPLTAELSDIDLSLDDRNRVSALPWRGQFSPLTVERLLGALAPNDAVILDPFVGSGTVLIEAAGRRQPAIGLDINPAAIALARCAALASLPVAARQAAVERAARAAFSAPEPSLGAGIDEAHALALLAHMDGSPDAAKRRLDVLLAALPETPVRIEALLRDARATGLATGSVGFVLTSPPYINVFNYHQYGRPLSDSFGWPILMAARSEIGSNRQNRGNRFRTVVQYSIDMALALAELSRVLVRGGTVVLVLGRESRVRGVPFFNAEILARLATDLGLFEQKTRAERPFVSRFGQRIFEDILVLRGSRQRILDSDEVLSAGRAAGLHALHECAAVPGTSEEVAAAVAAAPDLAASPLAEGIA